MTDFAAIDFETANECPSSVCSVGVVVVREGEIVDSFYSLIHPEPEYYKWFCRHVHGLGPDDTDDAPVFPFVWEKIEPLIEGLPLVAHNSRFDEGCLKSVFKVYQMDYPDYEFFRHPCGLTATFRLRPAQPPAPDRRRCLRVRPHESPSRSGRCRGMRRHRDENPVATSG